MSRIAATKNEQAAVDKYLLPKEVRVATVRRHPAVLLLPSAQAVGGLLAAAALSATILRGHGLLEGVVWVGWGILMLWLIWDVANWAVDYFVITSDRILLMSGLFTRSVNMMPLSKVTEMSFHRTFVGRLLGYGDFVVEAAGKDAVLRNIDHIPYPEQLYLVVCGRIFKDAAAEESDFDGGGDDGDGDGAALIGADLQADTQAEYQEQEGYPDPGYLTQDADQSVYSNTPDDEDDFSLGPDDTQAFRNPESADEDEQ
jgi:membrane protein YdbS with pleckstrin-like domain